MNEILNNRIAEIRKDRGLTQTELAERAGVSQFLISRAESGQSSIEVKCRIADALNLPVPDVFPDMPAILCKRCMMDKVLIYAGNAVKTQLLMHNPRYPSVLKTLACSSQQTT